MTDIQLSELIGLQLFPGLIYVLNSVEKEINFTPQTVDGFYKCEIRDPNKMEGEMFYFPFNFRSSLPQEVWQLFDDKKLSKMMTSRMVYFLHSQFQPRYATRVVDLFFVDGNQFKQQEVY